ncbi:MAG: nucleotidyltransferase domain-containing protein [Desulfobacterales bacterium]|nr:nucleotidyltransferase domain-containing protein [Desulfobacterales bacterium]
MVQATPKIRRIIFRYIKNLSELGVPVETVYLFGSQVRQNITMGSDVDIAVISPLFEKMSLWDKAGFLGKAAWDIPFPMDVLGFAPSQVRNAEPGTLLGHILKSGIEITH